MLEHKLEHLGTHDAPEPVDHHIDLPGTISTRILMRDVVVRIVLPRILLAPIGETRVDLREQRLRVHPRFDHRVSKGLLRLRRVDGHRVEGISLETALLLHRKVELVDVELAARDKQSWSHGEHLANLAQPGWNRALRELLAGCSCCGACVATGAERSRAPMFTERSFQH